MRLAVGCLAVLLLAPLVAGAAAVRTPRAVVEETVEEVLLVLKNSDLPTSERHRRVEEIAYSAFDFPTMSRLVLGRSWRRFTPEQKSEFERQFKRFLANNYRSRVDGYAQEEVEILGERKEQRGDVTVRTRIVGGEYEGANIDYRLRNRSERWLVIDVVIEGISLVSNYRDQFKAVLSRKGGPDELLERLREKNAEVAAASAEG